MSFPTSVPLCPACAAPLSQKIPGTKGSWSCHSHGDFLGGTGTSATVAATVHAAAELVYKGSDHNTTKRGR